MQTEKYGFVYIWYDRKHKRFYIGSHWGTEDDGYVCSSSWMKQAYKKRQKDFKRRILKRIYTSRQDLLDEENRWLAQIQEHELRKKYYNLRNHEFGHYSTDETKFKSAVEKMKNSLIQFYANMSEEERKEKCGYWKNKTSPNKGKSLTETQREHLRQINLGKQYPNRKPSSRKDYTHSDETRIKISEANKGNKNRLNTHQTNEVKQKIGKKNSINMKEKWKNPEYIKMILEARSRDK